MGNSTGGIVGHEVEIEFSFRLFDLSDHCHAEVFIKFDYGPISLSPGIRLGNTIATGFIEKKRHVPDILGSFTRIIEWFSLYFFGSVAIVANVL